MLIALGRLSLGSIAGVIVGAIAGHYFLKLVESINHFSSSPGHSSISEKNDQDLDTTLNRTKTR